MAPPPLITLEEHFYSEAVFSSLDDRTRKAIEPLGSVLEDLRELGEKRLSSMESGKVSLQVISHAFVCGGPTADACYAGNDEVATKIAQSNHSERFAAFAALPVADPGSSARELERAVKKLNFLGALVDNHANGQYFDAPSYDVLWSKAQELDVPIYIHPTWPSADMLALTYTGNFSEATGRSIGTIAWGWHSDVAVHILRLYAAGIFDRFPRLKIIIGHFGEMLPFMLERIDTFSNRFGGVDKMQRSFWEVYDNNIWITTAGNWSLAPMRCLLENTKVERILYSVDYPFARNEDGLKWWEALEESRMLTEDQLEMVAFRNAEALLKVKAPAPRRT